MINGLPIIRTAGFVGLLVAFIAIVQLGAAQANPSNVTTFKIGSRVRLAAEYSWAHGALGTVALPPRKVQELAVNFVGPKRIVQGVKGPITFYWVSFDTPQKDAEGAGPFFGAEIDEAFLKPDQTPPTKARKVSEPEVEAVWYENKKLNLRVEYKAFLAMRDSTPWPPLPTKGFTRGRAATQADVEAGDAVFSAQVAGKIIGEPIDIGIPQYAEWNDKGTHKRVILVQAEKANGFSMVGLRVIATGADVAATLPELKLLGTKLK